MWRECVLIISQLGLFWLGACYILWWGKTEFIDLPEGTIQKLIRKGLTENDDPAGLGD